MKAVLSIRCNACDKVLGQVLVDTADLPCDLQAKINKVILRHRSECESYGGKRR